MIRLQLPSVTLKTGERVTDQEATRVILAMRELIQQNPEFVIWRIKARLFGGLMRPSFAVRLKMITGALIWFLDEIYSYDDLEDRPLEVVDESEEKPE